MAKNRKKKRQKPGFLGEVSHRLPTVAGMILGGMFLGYIFFTKDGVPLYRAQVQAAENLERRIHEIKTQNAILEEEIRLVQTDSRKLEELARNHLGMVRKGETVYQFVEPQVKHAPPHL
ncbi:MAG: septum formation initiator family protein [Nitrospirales bacterium]|nr:septum formation initiator family protein [Nitrospira sp.]MDR4502610.1 septum formation initiator family protein [Nitrospirales bacterium]